MTFSKREDGFWHWECSGQKGSCRTIVLAWILCLVFVVAAILLANPGPEHRGLYLTVSGCLVLGITAFFGVICLLRRTRKTFRYTANEHRLCFFGTFKPGYRMSLPFSQVKSLKPIPDENTIRVWAGPVPVDLYASGDDFEAVWRFLTGHCPGAKIN